jgi:hypothetical protein
MRYTLTQDGKPTDIEVIAKSNKDVFESKAREQLAHMHFEPFIETANPSINPARPSQSAATEANPTKFPSGQGISTSAFRNR